MLFDLRSRGRRRTVQVIYIGLAVVIAVGLIGVGVGTGSGNGGLLNALTGSGGDKQNSIAGQQAKQAEQRTKQNPSDASAWGALVSARWSDANSGGFDQSTNQYTTAGRKTLLAATQAWTRYAALTKSPDPDVATVAARAFAVLGQYSDSAGAWQVVTQRDPGQLKGYECLALSAYAAKQDRIAGLAEGHVLSKLPKAQRKQIKATLESAKTQPTAAANC